MSPFRHLLRARYPECDAQGIVFNARYGDWVDLATTELLRAIDPALLAPGGVDYRLRRQEIDWLAPARFDDVVEAVPRVTAVGNTSFRVETTFTRLSAGPFTPEGAPARLVVVTTVYVLVDPATGEKREIPPLLRDLLHAGAPGRVTDHAGVGGGRVCAVIRAADRTTMPWANGGGITHELYKEPTPTGFAVRLSIAEVAADGPFSLLPGIDRVLTLLDGAGFRLRRADGAIVAIDRPLVPFAFMGEDAWDCTLVDGPVRDFNVMVDRTRASAAVARVGPGIVHGDFLLALAAGRVGGVALAAWDLARLDGPVLCEVHGLAVTLTRR